MLRNILKIGLLYLLAATPLGAHALSEVGWLHQIELPVQEQSSQERTRVASQGLLTVLSRVTGLASVPRSDVVVAAMAAPDRFYGSFVFHEERDLQGERTLYLKLDYQPDAVLELIKQAQLPVWWSKRPSVMVWLVVDEQGMRRLLGSEDEHPVIDAVRARARARGLSVSLPVLDLAERLEISAADVWGKVRDTLDHASARYNPDLVLVGRFSQRQQMHQPGEPIPFYAPVTYRGDWEVWLADQPLVSTFNEPDPEAAARLGVDLLADRLAEQYAVLPRQQRLRTFAIAGLEDAQSYVDLMRYLHSLEFVDQVDVVAVTGGQVQLQVASRALPEQLLMLLTLEQRLSVDRLHRGLETQLIWRG